MYLDPSAFVMAASAQRRTVDYARLDGPVDDAAETRSSAMARLRNRSRAAAARRAQAL